MAKNHAGTSQNAVSVEAPDGFVRLGSVANAGWFDNNTIGNTLKGSFEGMYTRKDDLNPKKESNFFQVRCTAECQVRMGKGEDAAIVTTKSGDYVNLNYGPKTKDLEKLVNDLNLGAKYDVLVVVKGPKLKLSGGRTMHDLDVFKKMVRAPEAVDDSEPDFSGSADDAPAA